MSKCNCIPEMEEKLKKAALEQINPDTIHELGSSGLKGVSFIMSGKGGMVIPAQYELAYRAKKRDGSPAKNLTRKEFSIMPSFCQFCGIKLRDDK